MHIKTLTKDQLSDLYNDRMREDFPPSELNSEHMDSTGNIIGEVEDPKYARNDDDRKLRIRRMDFYLRNGCFDTGVRAKCFGVEFIILRMGKKKLEKQKCWDIYSAIYRSILPKDMYDENIELLGFTDDQGVINGTE